MLPDRVSNPGTLTYESGALPIALRGPANEKVCCAHDLGSYAQGQGRNQVRGRNLVSAITKKLLKQI